jgi:IS1 family transposase
MLLAWHVGRRTPEDTLEFTEKLRRATTGRFQLTTDGYGPYRTEVPFVFGPRIDYAMLVKSYGESEEGSRRYSPPRITGIDITPITGNPDLDRACTSHVERHNLSIRMAVRRMTRLTNAFSKKRENHAAAMALFFVFYNYCRPHQTLTKYMGYSCTPAMKAGLAEDVWSVAELLDKIAS